MPEIRMPKLSDTMEEGKILRWLKSPGEAVEVGDLLVEVETDKADMEVEADVAGVIQEIRLPEGDSGPVGTVIAVIGDGSDVSAGAPAAAAPAAPEPPPAAAPPPPAAAPETARTPAAESAPPAPPTAPLAAAPAAIPGAATGKRVSPLARSLATELGIDPEALEGTGPGGRVVRSDVEAAHKAKRAKSLATAPQTSPAPPAPGPTTPPLQRKPAPAATADQPGVKTVRPPARTDAAASAMPAPPGGSRRVPLSGMRAAIARRMAESKREAPHFYLETTAELDLAVTLRSAMKESGGPAAAVTYNHMVIKAVADALRVHPEVNARFVGDAVELLNDINIGVATAVTEGLIVPVLHGVDRMSLVDIAGAARALAERARDRKLGGDDLSGGTFTVSNLGMFGVERFSAVINPPQAAILAVGAVAQRPVVRDGTLDVAWTTALTLSCDHRSIDGAVGGQFLAEVKRRLENPTTMLFPEEG